MPVPVAPHAVGALPMPGQTVLEGRYNYTQVDVVPNKTQAGQQTNLYLEHIAQARLAHAVGRTELSLFGDYAFHGWAKAVSPGNDLTC